ncbi:MULTISPECIES: hypothetical protein [Acinetobacter]|uniref:hypothetical protein n=1 Tax=Acinetobacter TaxID=469 RepID=UPI00148F3E92|nr:MULTISPECIES: hypothetical protein [Acinetobacter]MEB3797065.1 hypothetical protein [Acinetobacter sp. IK24]MEB3816195.1 hypothetical protein [Acinetobacter sp. IK22]MEB3835438.1 hypothetical protein [Acinetobacter sp. IK23]MEB3839089.1 hypothetical protein [Acinetobacter sp. IK25]
MLEFESRPSEASIKLYERSEFRVSFALAFAFSQIHGVINQKIAPESSDSEIQQSLSEAKTKGNFDQIRLLIIFNGF